MSGRMRLQMVRFILVAVTGPFCVFGNHYRVDPYVGVNTYLDTLGGITPITVGTTFFLSEGESTTFLCKTTNFYYEYIRDFGGGTFRVNWFLDGVMLPRNAYYSYLRNFEFDINHIGHEGQEYAGYLQFGEFELTLTPTMAHDSTMLSCELQYGDTNFEQPESSEFLIRVCSTTQSVCADESNCATICDGNVECSDSSDEDLATVKAESMTFLVNGDEYDPESDVVLPSGNHEFQCISEDVNPLATITWQFGNDDVEQTSGDQMPIGLCRFTTTSAVTQAIQCDSVRVTCFASNSEDVAPISTSVTIINLVPVIAGSVTFLINGSEYAPDSDVVLPSGNYEFQCISEDVSPAATITWQFGNDDVEQTSGDQISNEQCRFTTTSAVTQAIQCNVRVTCFASNSEGSDPIIIGVNIINSAPVIGESVTFLINGGEYPSESDVVLPSGNYEFQCISGDVNPAATITWQFGNDDVEQTSGNQISNGQCRFTTTSAVTQAIQCNVKVTCFASNSEGSDPIRIGVNIINSDPVIAGSVTFLINGVDYAPDSTVVLPSSNHEFQCISGDVNPAATITWQFGNDDVEQTSGDQMSNEQCRFTTTSVVTQAIQCNVRVTCFASNSEDVEPISIVVNIINLAPVIAASMTFLINGIEHARESTVVLASGNHEFQCVSGDVNPAATITWQFGNDDVEQTSGLISNGQCRYNTTSTVTQNIRWDVRVTCFASNSEDVEPISIDIIHLVICDGGCLNGATCINYNTCVCATGFTGLQCETFTGGVIPIRGGIGITLTILSIDNVPATCTPEILDPTTLEYQQLTARLTPKLEQLFCKPIQDCNKIIIDGFSCGSIQTEFTLILESNTQTTINDVMALIAYQAVEEGVYIGEGLIISPSGTEVVATCNVACSNGGSCTGPNTCSCVGTGYQGYLCETTDSGLSKPAIIAIAVGLPGFIIIVVAILGGMCIMAMHRQQRHQRVMEGLNHTPPTMLWFDRRPTGRFTVPYIADGREAARYDPPIC